uniref:Uncharacterized protein n=1 Tax=Rhizophora mucronata TaxID=61149 RepID=A0A2P2QH46_RHIMU
MLIPLYKGDNCVLYHSPWA